MPSPHPVDPPYNLEAECTTIGALLVDPERLVDVVPVIGPEDFYDPSHRLVYAAMRQLYEDRKPVDFVTVAEALRSSKRIADIGGSAFLASLTANVPTAAHAGD